jgi:hypothetical protein
MTKKDILKTSMDYDAVKDFLADVLGEHVIGFDVWDHRDGRKMMTVAVSGRCGEDYYDDYTVDEIMVMAGQ